MNFKEKLELVVRRAFKKKLIRTAQYELSLFRTSNEDWEIIKTYLETVCLKLASQSSCNYFFDESWTKYKGKYFIILDFESEPIKHPKYEILQPLILTDGSKLEINYKDIERFCEENNLKLKFRYILKNYEHREPIVLDYFDDTIDFYSYRIECLIEA